MKNKIKKSNPPKKAEPFDLAKCFLEHAARETVFMRTAAANCEYIYAHNAGERRSVWLLAALLVQEQIKPEKLRAAKGGG